MIFNGRRNRTFYFVFFVAIIFLGFFSRVFATNLPTFIGNYLPDALWGMMVFFGLGMLFDKASTTRLAMYSLLFAYGIECSQLLQHPILMELRSTTFGGLVLGHGFLWSDLVCYTVGIFVGVMLEIIVQKRRNTP